MEWTLAASIPAGNQQKNNNFWLVVSTYPSEKYEFVSWDDELPNWMKKIKFMFQPPTRLGIQNVRRSASNWTSALSTAQYYLILAGYGCDIVHIIHQ